MKNIDEIIERLKRKDEQVIKEMTVILNDGCGPGDCFTCKTYLYGSIYENGRCIECGTEEWKNIEIYELLDSILENEED